MKKKLVCLSDTVNGYTPDRRTKMLTSREDFLILQQEICFLLDHSDNPQNPLYKIKYGEIVAAAQKKCLETIKLKSEKYKSKVSTPKKSKKYKNPGI